MLAVYQKELKAYFNNLFYIINRNNISRTGTSCYYRKSNLL